MTTDQEVVNLLGDALQILAVRTASVIGTDAAQEVVVMVAAAYQAVGLPTNPDLLANIERLRASYPTNGTDA